MPRKVSRRVLDSYPPVQEVELYWIDERQPNRGRRKVTRYTHGRMEIGVARGTIFNPGVCRMESRDVDALVTWVKARLHEGWINESDLQEKQDLMRRLIRKQKAQQFAAPNPEATAGIKPSGKGQKGSHKPTRDYRLGISKGNGTVVSTVMGRDFGPAKG